ncbi:Flavinator of succinate dehydrogenase domain containing protein [Lactarius tabidus]
MSTLLRRVTSRSLALRGRLVPTRHLSSCAVRRKDPWPMPHTPEHISSTATPTDLPAPEPLPRTGESIETTRARLVYQSRKRGTLENDLLLGTFAQEHLGAMDAAELSEFDKLMDEADWDIYYWATGKRSPPERWVQSKILEKLRVHARNEGKVVRRMPDLH